MNEMQNIHHPSLITACEEKLSWWKQEIDGNHRCKTCWLRSYDCFCQTINEWSVRNEKQFGALEGKFNLRLEVLIYYHNSEIGRSANTAHVFQAGCSSISGGIIYGVIDEEQLFWEKLVKESSDNSVYTCVLYPGKQSLVLSEWFAQISKDRSRLHDRKDVDNCVPVSSRKAIRFIVLDGTYAAASRIARYLETCKEKFLPQSPTFQFVSLELQNDSNRDYCRSAMAGIMYQPAKEKICSYQATAIAIKDILLLESQCHSSSTANGGLIMDLFHQLIEDLHRWIAYLVTKKIKFGKVNNSRKSISDVDNTPAPYLMEIINSQPKQMYPPSKTANSKRSIIRRQKAFQQLCEEVIANRRSAVPTPHLYPTMKFAVYGLTY